MKKLYFILLLMPLHGLAQQLFEDASGEANFFINTASFSWIRFNSSTNTVTLGYNRLNLVGNDGYGHKFNWLIGTDMRVNVKDGIGNVFKKKEFSPGVSFNGNFGIHSYDVLPNNSYAAYYLRGGISYTEYKFAANINNAPTLTKEKEWEGQLLANANWEFNIKKKKADRKTKKQIEFDNYLFVGVSSGYKRANNFEDLDDVQFNTSLYSGGNLSIISSEKAKLGSYEGYHTMPLNFDIAYTPRMFGQSNIGFNTYLRTKFFKPDNTVNAGFGMYVTKQDHPSNIVGGVAWQFNDVGNILDKDETLVQRSSLFFYVGFAITSK